MQRILFLVSSNNGLSQRAALALRQAGNSVRIAVVSNEAEMLRAVAPRDFHIIICPFLKARIPESIWQTWPTIIIHPGPIGDRGPSSLDWTITTAERNWGVTAIAAVEEMDAGPIWAWRTFSMPDSPIRKSALYNGPVADAAIECILDVVAKAADPSFVPTPLAEMPRPVLSARLRPTMRQADRAFTWGESSTDILRRVHAADGSPGVLALLGDGGTAAEAYVYDAHLGGPASARPGSLLSRRHGAIQIATGDSSVWIGHMRAKPNGIQKTIKLPATNVAQELLSPEAILSLPVDEKTSYHQIHYQRRDDIGFLTFQFYNGAMNTGQCRRLLKAFRFAEQQNTKVLVLQGGWDYFSNGINLNVIEAATRPAVEAWNNIKAINAVCRAIVSCTTQLVISAFTGNAGAGGVMLPLGADIVVARDGVVLNPHYATMGLYGSELHTYTLPRRVGKQNAARLTTDCLPISAQDARDIEMVDEIGPRDQSAFTTWLTELAQEYTSEHRWQKMITAKEQTLDEDAAHRPLDAYELFELGHMTQDMFDNRNNFAERRHRFVLKL